MIRTVESKPPILIEGATVEELVRMPELEEIVFVGEPITFRVGQANILAEFSTDGACLCVELAVVENGGEGVLPVLVQAVERRARAQGLAAIEWIAYATDCAVPNPKLTRVLERLGFENFTTKTGANCLRRRTSTNESLMKRSSVSGSNTSS